MKSWARALVLAAAVLSTTACADEASVKKALTERFAGMPVEKISKAPMKGWYEVYADGQLFYTDEKANYLFIGNVIDAKSRESLTEKRLEQLSAIQPARLPLEQAVKIVRGDGSRQLIVFSDPDCPFCKKLERELQQLNNLTVYVFLYPLDSLHPQARKKAQRVWCASDRAAAWLALMLENQAPDNNGDCDNPVQATVLLAEKLGIRGTPALVFPNGRKVSGAVPAAEIERLLRETEKSKK